MTKYCIFRLYGNMVSFGDLAVGIDRHTVSHPTKSSVFGFIAGALGIKRDNEDMHKKLADYYGFSSLVRIYGKIISDYHTAQAPHSTATNKSPVYTRRDELNVAKDKLNTVLSNRDYVCDQLSQICIWERSGDVPYTLEEIAHSIAYPVFTPYVGRKACVLSLPSSPKIVYAENLRDAYTNEKVSLDNDQFIQNFKIQLSNEGYLYWDLDGESGVNSKDDPISCAILNDNLTSRSRWQYSGRKEYSAVISLNHGGA